VTSSPYIAKALQAWSRLAGHGDDAALIVIYASADAPASAGRDALRDFSQRMSPAIDRMLESARESGK
jgi:hypothetical protein